jgi:hypothetical protein
MDVVDEHILMCRVEMSVTNVLDTLRMSPLPCYHVFMLARLPETLDHVVMDVADEHILMCRVEMSVTNVLDTLRMSPLPCYHVFVLARLPETLDHVVQYSTAYLNFFPGTACLNSFLT